METFVSFFAPSVLEIFMLELTNSKEEEKIKDSTIQ